MPPGGARAPLSRTRTLLVAVNDLFLDGVVEWVASEPRLEVVGRAHSGEDALERAAALGVELLLVDVTLPDFSGFEVARRIKSRPDAPLVVLFSFHDSQTARQEAWAAGADGFVATSETADCLLPLVGELLRQRQSEVRELFPGSPSIRMPRTDVSR